MTAPLTQAAVRDIFNYDPDSGRLTWRQNRGSRARAGGHAGTKTTAGYLHVRFDGRDCYVHRLAWLYVYGSEPRGEVDHINGNPGDNRLTNLREATREQNSRNMVARKTKAVGLKGVHIHKSTGKFAAQITVSGQKRHLGLHSTAEDAHAAYLDAAKLLHGTFYSDGVRR